MVRMLVPCSTNAAVRTCPCWGWLVPAGAGQWDVPAKAFQQAMELPWKHKWSVKAVNPVALSIKMWPPCLSSSWKWWVLHSFSWSQSGIWRDRLERVNLWSFPGFVTQMGIWIRSHEEHSQKLLISQHLYPLVSKSFKSLHAFEPSLRSGWIFWGQNLSPLTSPCEILCFTINPYWEMFLTGPVIFLLDGLGSYVVPWRAEPAHPQQCLTWWERHVCLCWQMGRTFIRWWDHSCLGAEPRPPNPSTLPGGISFSSDLAS